MSENGRVQGRRWIFDDCEYLERGRQLRVRGAQVRMEAKPLDVLQVLLERPAEVLTKDQLLGEVWEVATSVVGNRGLEAAQGVWRSARQDPAQRAGCGLSDGCSCHLHRRPHRGASRSFAEPGRSYPLS